jgi:hypothetical protein
MPEASTQPEEEQAEPALEGQEELVETYPSVEAAALDMVMDRAELDDPLAVEIRSALIIIDECLTDYG